MRMIQPKLGIYCRRKSKTGITSQRLTHPIMPQPMGISRSSSSDWPCASSIFFNTAYLLGPK